MKVIISKVKTYNFIFSILIIFSFMCRDKKLNNPYSVIQTSDCIKYIKSFGLTIKDYEKKISIPSEGGLIYKLPNNEVVLIPSSLDDSYSGFIFTDMNALNNIIQKDYFPIDTKLLTFWEIERDNLDKIGSNTEYFAKVLNTTLSIHKTKKNYFEDVYNSVYQYLRNEKSELLRNKIVVSYSIIVMNYLTEKKGAQWFFDKRYEVYNSYKYPMIKTDEKIIDVITDFWISMDTKKGNFLMFSSFVGLDD